MDILKKQIRNRKITKSYLFYGPESYLIEYYLGEIKKELIPEGTEAFNLVEYEGAVSPFKISEFCDSMPVLSDRRLVVLKDTGYFKSGRGSMDEVVDILSNLPDYICLVFIEDSIDKRLKTVKQIDKNGLVVEFPNQRPDMLVKWIEKVVKSYGKKIDKNNSLLIIEYCEPGMSDILKEIEKIVLYAGERQVISAEDIEHACTKTLKTRVFDLLDSVFAKDISKALIMLDEMITLKEPIPKILFMVARQFKLLIRAMEMKERHANKYDIAKELGVRVFVAEKLLQQTRGFSKERLKHLVKLCLQTDFDVKTGNISDRMGLELLIAAISA